MTKKRSFFIHFEITEQCLQHAKATEYRDGRDVFDNLAGKMRQHPQVLTLLEGIGDKWDKIIIGVGREINTE